MSQHTMDNEKFLEIRGYSIENNPLVYSSHLNAIKIEESSFAEKFIILSLPNGKDVKMNVTKSFFKDLSSLLSIKISMQKNMEHDMFSKLLEALKTLQSTNGISQVHLMYNPVERSITHINTDGFNRISNSQLFGFAETLVNKYPQLAISNVIGGKGSADAEIKIVSNDNIKIISDSTDIEEFNFGISLSNVGINTTLCDYAYRLVCSNGMMGIRTDERFKLQGTGRENMTELFGHFDVMEKENFIPADFEDNINNAVNTMVSFDEMQNAINAISDKIVGEFPEQTEQWVEGMISMHFPQWFTINQKLKIKGYDPLKLTTEQKKLIKTDMNMWELVNVLTDLGSNKTPYTIRDKRMLQKLGGKYLTKNFDLKDLHLLYL